MWSHPVGLVAPELMKSDKVPPYLGALSDPGLIPDVVGDVVVVVDVVVDLLQAGIINATAIKQLNNSHAIFLRIVLSFFYFCK
jgi:hypothetical protein